MQNPNFVLPQCKFVTLYKKGIPILLFVFDSHFTGRPVSFCTHAKTIKLLQNTKLTQNTKSETDNKIDIPFLYIITNLYCGKTKYTNLHYCHQKKSNIDFVICF